MRNTIFFTGLSFCILGMVTIANIPQIVPNATPSYRLCKDGSFTPLDNAPDFEVFMRQTPPSKNELQTATACALHGNPLSLKP
jgi:hypothetical protein